MMTIRKILAWVLYYIGDFVCDYIMIPLDGNFGTYRLYNWIMFLSDYAQGPYDSNGPWKHTKNK